METIIQLKKTFELLSQSSCEGVLGIFCKDSQKPGPALGITICTHGNEPSGLAAAQFLLDEFNGGTQLICGKLYIVINNLEGAKRFFSAETDEEKRKARVIDINFNRLPKNTLLLQNDNRYEIKRAQELRKIWQQFDVALDIHSTTQENGEMIINIGETLQTDLIKGFSMKKIISNIDNIQIGKPAAGFYGKPGKTKIVEIECGQHLAQTSFQVAIHSVKALLNNLGMASFDDMQTISRDYEEYIIFDSIIFPNTSYELDKLFENFEFVKKGMVLARGDGKNIVASEDCHVLFAAQIKPNRIDEEVIFLSKPVQIKKI